MTSLTRDPLLAIAKGLLLFLMAAMAIGAAACLVAMPCVVVFRDQIASQIAGDLPGIDPNDVIGALLVVLVLAMVLIALVWKVLQLLKRIVDTVGEGDPFVPVNARRLTAMAWLVLAIQVVSLPLFGLAMWLSEHADKAHADVDVGGDAVSGNGLLLVLVLFILARVFRQGAAMRAELESTV